jgi:hypothetical protein
VTLVEVHGVVNLRVGDERMQVISTMSDTQGSACRPHPALRFDDTNPGRGELPLD